MTSDFPGGLGPAEPGLDQLIGTLTSGPTADELAGEQSALAMFRANIHPLAPVTGMGAAPGTAALDELGEGSSQQTRVLRRRRVPRFRLVAAGTVVALVGGFAAAAYAAVLPAPLQHVAYQALHSIGVPDARHSAAVVTNQRPTSKSQPRSRHGGTPAPAHSGPPQSGSGPAAQSPPPSSSGTAGPPAGQATVSVTAVASQIPAGTAATIDGQLTRAGQPVAGVQVRLWERLAGSGWRLAGVSATSAQGTVSMSVTDLEMNARFRLTDPDGPVSPPATVIVVPQVTTSLTLGPGGVDDYLSVTTVYARRGDSVQLQVYVNGSWVSLRERFLNGAGATVFAFSASKLEGDQVRVMVLATWRHAAAVSSPVVVPPPA